MDSKYCLYVCSMTRIGLLSDTHHYLDPALFKHFEKCDEIWHAGDFATVSIAEQLQAFKPLTGVYGNIDGQDVRSRFGLNLSWTCEGVKVYMIHIGGHPNRYAPGIKTELMKAGAQLFVCGHSHILKIMYDDSIGCLHINPGAAGNQGWHKIKTAVRFTIDGRQIRDCEVIEFGKRGITGPLNPPGRLL